RDIVDRQVGEDNAPAEGDARRIALEYLDLVARVAQLHRDREVEPRRPRADARDPHGQRPPKVTKVASPGVPVRPCVCESSRPLAKLNPATRDRIAAAWHSSPPVGQPPNVPPCSAGTCY